MTQHYRKKLIEVALPLTVINDQSGKEKSKKVGKPSSIHMWWARRPFAACRAVLFAQLIDDPSAWPEKFPTLDTQKDERDKLFDIISSLVDWEKSTQPDTIYEARRALAKYTAWSNDDTPPVSRDEIDAYLIKNIPIVYDPFCGGGGIPLEAQRLGLRAWGSDLNPVAVTISKALVDFPEKFKSLPPMNPYSQNILQNSGVWNSKEVQGLCEDIEYYGKLAISGAFEEIGHLYPLIDLPEREGGGKADVISWIWARTVRSPNPAFNGAHVPLVKSFILSSGKKEQFYIDPIPNRETLIIEYNIRKGKPATDMKTVHRNGATCIFTGDAITFDYIENEGKAKRMGFTLMAIVAKGRTGRVYLERNEEQEKLALSIIDNNVEFGKIDHLTSCTNCVVYGLDDFADLFTARQKIALSTIADQINKIKSIVKNDALKSGLLPEGAALQSGGDGAAAYADAVSIYLALILDRVADWNSSMSRWEPQTEVPQQTFGRQAIPMVWDFAEANPLGSATGSFLASMKNVNRSLESLRHLSTIKTSSNIFQADSTQPFNEISENVIIATDPPYYDNIPYSILSDFFYVWLRKSLFDVFPELFRTLLVPKQNEIVANKNRHKGVKNAERFFLNSISTAFVNIAKIANDDYPLTIFYAFKQSEVSEIGVFSTGWSTFLEGVLGAGLSVVGTWPIRTENTTRMMAQGNNALANSVVLVCRKRDNNSAVISRSEFNRALKRELPGAIAELQAANIAPTDMPQSAIGPGMAIFSQYKAVLESDDSPMSVKTALQLINRELGEHLEGIQGDFDADTRFAITWFEQNGLKAGDYGTANNIATARGISVESVKHAGIVESQAGKVRVLRRDELDEKWEPGTDQHLTIWECLQHLVRLHEKDGISHATAILLKKIGDKAEAVKDLAYILYDISANKRQDAKEATAYNALIADWAELTRQAVATHDTRGNSQTQLDI